MSTALATAPEANQMETSTAGAGSRQFALINAAHTRALMHPRRWPVVEARLLDACSRIGVALKATYTLFRTSWNPDTRQKDRLTVIPGPSVRLAEESIRALGNTMRIEDITLDNDRELHGTVALIDLDSNNIVTQPWRVSKIVEKRKVFDGEVVLEERINSKGAKVYVCPAPDSELRVRMRAATARARRDCTFEVMPSDVLELALARCRETRAKALEDPKTKAATVREIADILTAAKVRPEQIQSFLGGCKLTDAPAARLLEVLEIANAIEETDVPWETAVDAYGYAAAQVAESANDDPKRRAALLAEAAKIRTEDPDWYSAEAGRGGVESAEKLPVAALEQFVIALKQGPPKDDGKAQPELLPAGSGRK